MPNWIFLPFALVYGLVTSIRNKMFDWGILPSKKYDIPIIGIGNLSTGGTGKSPHTIYVVDALKSHFKIAVVSRGYGRKTKGLKVANYQSTYEEIGDEPLQIFERFRNKIVVIVSEIRTKGIDLAIANYQCNLAVLDDCFQHRYVNPGLKIVLTAFNKLYSDDYLLPVGNLRESRANAHRANVIIVTKCPKEISQTDKEKIINQLQIQAHQQVFFSSIEYSNTIQNRNSEIHLEELKDTQVLLVTGIANPKPLIAFLEKKVKRLDQMEFKDHHKYSLNEVNTMYEEIQAMTGDKVIITTEKDYMRLRQYEILEPYLYYLPIETHVHDAEQFNSLLLEYATKNYRGE